MSVSMGKWLIFCHFTATANPIETHSDLALSAEHLKGLMHFGRNIYHGGFQWGGSESLSWANSTSLYIFFSRAYLSILRGWTNSGSLCTLSRSTVSDNLTVLTSYIKLAICTYCLVGLSLLILAVNLPKPIQLVFVLFADKLFHQNLLF